MPATLPVIVYPPSPTGGRRVRADGQILGLAYGLGDVVEFLRRAGLEMDEGDVVQSSLIEWRGGGWDVWTPPHRRARFARQVEWTAGWHRLGAADARTGRSLARSRCGGYRTAAARCRMPSTARLSMMAGASDGA